MFAKANANKNTAQASPPRKFNSAARARPIPECVASVSEASSVGGCSKSETNNSCFLLIGFSFSGIDSSLELQSSHPLQEMRQRFEKDVEKDNAPRHQSLLKTCSDALY
ncbi:hypothetical protein O181_047231 [Austropuccinia psidii MF-1]|uniref:Uncharacterized protein n=1 Tax=Austropuccinia psidii MF-1 TaxID=1389203 RepID=A0A9Q3DVP5_9BASI|nr:hypothetical protein [Austropuccinia psidii MF-1]